MFRKNVTARVFLTALAVLAIALGGGLAHAATFSSSATAPTVDGADISNFGTQTGSDKWFYQFQGKNEADPADWAKGQTFTTGASAVLLNALTYKIDPTQKKPANTTYTVRVGTLSGTTINQIASETALQTVDTGVGDYMTWTFATPVLLSPTTTYGIDVAMASAVAWNGGIPYLSYTGNAYPNGQFYNSGPTGGSGSGPTISVNAALDRVFHLDMMPPSPPSAYWDLNDTVDGAGDTAPSGIWDTSKKWNATADGTGPTAPWTAGLTAVFAAGLDATAPYTVTVDGTQDIGGLSFEEGTVTLTPALTGGTLSMTGFTTMNVASGLTATIATPISEDAAGRVLMKDGDGTLILSAVGSYSGATQVVAGTLRLGARDVLPAAATVMVGGNAPGVTATLDLDGNSQAIADLTLVNGSAVTTGAGTLALGGNVTYVSGPLGATISGKLDLAAATRTFTVNDSTTAADDLTVSAVISGAGVGLSKAGAGTLVLSGTNTYSGPTTINAGTLQMGDGGTTGSLDTSSEISVNGNLTFKRSDTVTQGTDFTAAAIIGNGSLTQAGTGTLVLSADNTYSGVTTVNAGILQVNGSLAAPGGLVTVATGGTLNIGASGSIARDVTVGGGVVNLAGTLTGTLSVTGGTVTTSPGSPTVATANLTAAAGTVTASTPLAVTSALKLPGSLTAMLTNGTSFTAEGSNLADNSVTRTLSLSGGTLAFSSASPGPAIDLISLASGSNVPGDTSGSNGTYIQASSYYKNDGRAPWHVSNWSGMTGAFPTATAISTTPAHTMWLSNGLTGAGTYISWNFNQPYTIGKIHIWNYNEINGAFTGRGVKTLTLETSTDGSTWTAVPGLSSTIDWTNIGSNGTISGAVQSPSGGSTTYAGFDWTLPSAITTQYLRFNNTQNFGTSDTYTGLSEVVFFEAAAPPEINLPNTGIAATASSTLDLGAASGNHTLGNLSITNGGTHLTLTGAAGLSLNNITGDSDTDLLADGVALTVPSGNTASNITAASLTKVTDGTPGHGTLTLSGNNTLADGTTVNAGTLVVNSAGGLGAGASLTINAGGTVVLTGGLGAAGAAASTAAAVPEPGTIALLAAGLAALLVAAWRKR